WQLAHDIFFEADRLVSKNSFWPTWAWGLRVVCASTTGTAATSARSRIADFIGILREAGGAPSAGPLASVAYFNAQRLTWSASGPTVVGGVPAPAATTCDTPAGNWYTWFIARTASKCGLALLANSGSNVAFCWMKFSVYLDRFM